ncbi:cytidine deaminase [Cohnella hongkongensis]|uniref:Cytidine deaminase n=1 Tax=Cohnella hongkongensis TaxID=178337 RepID=A0ABV9FE89_9BACL
MEAQMMNLTVERLVEEAAKARTKAYVPYSKFAVGAVAVDADGRLHHGCNVENAAYGPTNCAERTALFRAIADGCQAGQFRAVAVIGDTEQPIAPCGVCRQVLAELCRPDMPVVLANLRGDTRVTTVSELLPGAFSPRDLNNGEAVEGE